MTAYHLSYQLSYLLSIFQQHIHLMEILYLTYVAFNFLTLILCTLELRNFGGTLETFSKQLKQLREPLSKLFNLVMHIEKIFLNFHRIYLKHKNNTP